MDFSIQWQIVQNIHFSLVRNLWRNPPLLPAAIFLYYNNNVVHLTSHTCQRWKDRRSQRRWGRSASSTRRSGSSPSGPTREINALEYLWHTDIKDTRHQMDQRYQMFYKPNFRVLLGYLSISKCVHEWNENKWEFFTEQLVPMSVQFYSFSIH